MNRFLCTWILPMALAVGMALRAHAWDQPPPPGPAPSVALPEARVSILPNGLKLLLVERHTAPLVTLAVVIQSGGADDPANLPGTAQFVTMLLDQGTTTREASSIAEALDRLGGMVQKEAGWDDSILSVTVLSEHLEEGAELLADMALNSSFPSDAVERERRRTLSALSVAARDPSYVADAVFAKALFAPSSYGHSLDGTVTSIRRIRRDDLEAYHRLRYRPGNAVLILAGDFQPNAGRRMAEKLFGSWWGSAAEPQGPHRGKPVLPSERRILVVDKPDAVQTEIRVGNLAVPRKSEDYEALEIANEILGGTAPDRLFAALREREGLAYGVESTLDARRYGGGWRIETATSTAGTVKSLRIIFREMERMTRRSVAPSEMELARSYLQGHLWLEFESSRQTANRLLEVQVYGLDADYWNFYRRRIGELRREEVLEAVRRWLHPERCLVVLVGNAAQFREKLREGLREFGKVKIEYVQIDKLDLDSPTMGFRPMKFQSGKP